MMLNSANWKTSPHPPQENIIREFNLNELFQKSKKLNKTLAPKEESSSRAQEGDEELREENEEAEQRTESKKDQWRRSLPFSCTFL